MIEQDYLTAITLGKIKVIRQMVASTFPENPHDIIKEELHRIYNDLQTIENRLREQIEIDTTKIPMDLSKYQCELGYNTDECGKHADYITGCLECEYYKFKK